MTVPRWPTRVVGLGLIAVLAAVLGIVAALPAGAAKRDQPSGSGVSTGNVSSVDAHLVTGLHRQPVAKRLSGIGHAVVPDVITGVEASTTSRATSNPQSTAGAASGATAARAPPAEGTSRS